MNSYSVINYPVESFLAKLKSNKNDKKKGNKLPDKQRNSETNSTKKQFNVLIPIEPPYSIFNKEKSEIDGYSYDFWQIIKKKLENENYLFKETHVRTSDFNELIDEIQQGKYDIAPFPFFPSAEREKKVNFTLPIMYEKVAIVHRPLSDHKLIFFDYILKTVVPFMFIILAFGFLLGNLLYYFDKHRGYRRSILTSIASLFGEAGFLSERWGGRDGALAERHHYLKGLPMIIFIFVISYFFSMAMQAYTTARAVALSDVAKLSYNDIDGKTFALPIGYSAAMADGIERLGGKVKRVKGTILDIYKAVQDDKYQGLIIGQQRAVYDIKMHDIKGLVVTKNLDLSMQTGNFVVAKRYPKLTEKINQYILEAKETTAAADACKAHHPPENAFLCSL